MLGLILLYWVGKYFYQLAERNNRSKWGFAVLGILSYYAGIVLFGFLAGIILEITYPGFVEEGNDFLIGIMIIPFGILTCYGTYKLLENRWEKNTDAVDQFLVDDEENSINF
jgi:uncharacterized membrane protein HdeD (DUF308 family)